VTNVAATDATIEFRIGAGELPTNWVLYLEAPSCMAGNPGSCEASGGMEIWNGGVGASGETLTVDIAQVWGYLLPDTPYAFHIDAAHEGEERVSSPRQEFRTEAGPAPAIEETSVTNISARDATLNMKIDPNGLATSYEIMITSPNCPLPGGGGCASITVWLPHGQIGAAGGVQCLGLDLPSIGVSVWPEHPYNYRVRATNSVGTAEVWGGFTTPAEGAPPVRGGDGCPADPPGSQAGAPAAPIGQPPNPASPPHRKRRRHRKHERDRHEAGWRRGLDSARSVR
jgi:hypothetical protein